MYLVALCTVPKKLPDSLYTQLKTNTSSDSYRVKFFNPKQLIWCTPLQYGLQDLKWDTSGIVEHWENIVTYVNIYMYYLTLKDETVGLHSQLMLFWSARMHCLYKLIMLGRKVLFPEYTCIFLFSRWPVKCGSPGPSHNSFSTVKRLIVRHEQ